MIGSDIKLIKEMIHEIIKRTEVQKGYDLPNDQDHIDDLTETLENVQDSLKFAIDNLDDAEKDLAKYYKDRVKYYEIEEREIYNSLPFEEYDEEDRNIDPDESYYAYQQKKRNEYKKSFGYFLKQQRELKGMTQKELAEKIKVHYTYISKIEHNESTPSEKVAKEIADALKEDEFKFILKAGIIPTRIKEEILSNETLQDQLIKDFWTNIIPFK